jgi:hypothetical protein
MLKHKINKTNKKNGGAAMLIATMFFLAISMTVIMGLSVPIIKQLKITARKDIDANKVFEKENQNI